MSVHNHHPSQQLNKAIKMHGDDASNKDHLDTHQEGAQMIDKPKKIWVGKRPVLLLLRIIELHLSLQVAHLLLVPLVGNVEEVADGLCAVKHVLVLHKHIDLERNPS